MTCFALKVTAADGASPRITPRAQNNVDVLDWSLSEEQMRVLNGLPQRRMLTGTIFLNKEGPYKTLADLWDKEEHYATSA